MKSSQRKAIHAKKKRISSGIKKEGGWFKGNIFSGADFSADETKKAVEKYGKDVKTPHALRTKTINGKDYSQVYHKPIYPGEFVD